MGAACTYLGPRVVLERVLEEEASEVDDSRRRDPLPQPQPKCHVEDHYPRPQTSESAPSKVNPEGGGPRNMQQACRVDGRRASDSVLEGRVVRKRQKVRTGLKEGRGGGQKWGGAGAAGRGRGGGQGSGRRGEWLRTLSVCQLPVEDLARLEARVRLPEGGPQLPGGLHEVLPLRRQPPVRRHPPRAPPAPPPPSRRACPAPPRPPQLPPPRLTPPGPETPTFGV